MTTSTQPKHQGATTQQLKPLATFDFLQLHYDPTNDWLLAHWQGFASEEKARQGMEAILEGLKCQKTGKVLHDQSELEGPFQVSPEWMQQEFFPKALQAGCRAVAIAYSPNIFGKMSMDKVLKQTDLKGKIVRKPFGDLEEAAEWLRKQ